MYVSEKDEIFMDLGEGITQRILGFHEKIMLVEMTFQKGSRTALHSHSNHIQVIYVTKGKFEITCGDESRVVGPGEIFYADYNEQHGSVSLEHNSVLIDIHTPMRSDILKEGIAFISQER